MQPLQRVLAAIIALLLVAGVAGAVTVDDRPDGSAAPPAPTSSTGPPADGAAAVPDTTALPVSPELDAVVRELQAFVERERGLQFTQPLQVILEPDDRFVARIAELAAEDEEDLRKAEALLRALDLIPRDVDLLALRNELLSAAAIGFYDPKAKELVVRGTGLTPGVRLTLVHEITHALQDQVFNLDRSELDDRDDEARLGFSAVVEGDAVRVEEAYRRSLSAGERRQAAAESVEAASRINPFAFPPILLRLLLFPYTDGATFVDAVVQAGGQARLDEAIRNPPTTSEQVLHPPKFLRGEGPLPVDPPPAEGEVIDQGVMGELILRELLATEIGGERAARAATGWGGDRYVAWAAGGRTCIRTAVVMDTPNDAAELLAALRGWASAKRDARVTGGDGEPVTFTACG